MENGHKEGDPLGSSPWTELMVVKGKAGQCPGRRGQVRDVVGGGASRIISDRSRRHSFQGH